MLTDEQIETFHTQGFLIYEPPVVDAEELAELNAALQRVLDGKSDAQPEANRNLLGASERIVTQVVNIFEAEPAFRQHLYNPNIVPLIAQLTDCDTVRVWHDQIQVKPPFIGGPTGWHQDHPYWPIIEPSDLISAWMALEDATIENGCMWMVPGSHKWGPINGGTIGQKEDELTPNPNPEWLPEHAKVEIVPIEVPAGHVALHHCLTWHGAPPNKSAKNRPAIAVHYMPGYTRYQPHGGHLVEHNVEVQPGEPLKGKHFPTVMENGELQQP
jgi:ectoine hydroxylase-related dioxygenase (phytanoyl-CoA dioxygenase family)